jgi:hypothetical protein
MDNKKPVRKREVATETVLESQHLIYMTATRDAAEDMWQFGFMRDLSESRPDWYQLEVDPRYDFNEVLEYIQHYDEMVKLDESTLGKAIKDAVNG